MMLLLGGASACTLGESRQGVVGIGFAFTVDTIVRREEYGAMQIAIADLNARGASKHRFALRLVGKLPGNDNLADALATASAIRDDPTIVGAVGFSETVTTLGVADIVSDGFQDGDRAFAMITPSATGPDLSGASPWVFRLCPVDTAYTRAMAEYVSDTLGRRRAAILFRTSVHGRFLRDDLARQLRANGVDVALVLPHAVMPIFDSTDATWRLIAREIVRSGADAVVMPVHDQWPDLARALHAMRIHIPIIAGDGAGSYPTDSPLAAFYPGQLTPASDRRARFEREFLRRQGSPPKDVAYLAYDAAMAIGEAVIEGGATREGVRRWLSSLGVTRPAWTGGVTGPISFSAQNDRLGLDVGIRRIAP